MSVISPDAEVVAGWSDDVDSSVTYQVPAYHEDGDTSPTGILLDSTGANCLGSDEGEVVAVSHYSGNVAAIVLCGGGAWDDLGLWVEHPHYVIVQTNDAQGKPLPEGKQVRAELAANFLLRWEKIVTLVHFPNREGFDFPNPLRDRSIGFITEEEAD